MVMPRSRSMSIRSRYCARAARSSTTPVSCSIRSASVDLPWSMCAMMQKFRMIAGSVAPGTGAAAFGDTDCFPEGTVRRAPILPRRRRRFELGAVDEVGTQKRSLWPRWSSSTPPLASITFRDARLSASQVSSAGRCPGAGLRRARRRASGWRVPRDGGCGVRRTRCGRPTRAGPSSARGAARSGRRTPPPRSTTRSSGRRSPRTGSMGLVERLPDVRREALLGLPGLAEPGEVPADHRVVAGAALVAELLHRGEERGAPPGVGTGQLGHARV